MARGDGDRPRSRTGRSDRLTADGVTIRRAFRRRGLLLGDFSITLVELSLRGDAARARADEVRDWLLDTGVIVANPRVDAVWSPCGFVGGPRAADVVVGYEPDVAPNGVDIGTEWRPHVHTGIDGPDCPSCARRTLDGESYRALIEQWWEQRDEPVLSCGHCGGSAPLGDWPGEDTAYVGELWVTFSNWAITDEFSRTLGDRLGPRWRRLHLDL